MKSLSGGRTPRGNNEVSMFCDSFDLFILFCLLWGLAVVPNGDIHPDINKLRKEATDRKKLGLPQLPVGPGGLYIEGRTYDRNGDEFIDK
ncbi:hypothetical protein AAHR76_001368 [Yersinia enterocolitica]|uniref:hypothetical protein n=1 Tax=Yersinia intermedia TaxID=631 RepID=UPI0011A3C564|nr:hypothetical protein [Yersinia intermedia]